MSEIESLVRLILDRSFRGSAPIPSEMFPRHEFNEEEATRLAHFTSRICTDGYSFIDLSKDGETLNLAAEYGVFVEPEIGSWFLGVFLIAELLHEPSGQETYASSMVRSGVFAGAPKELQDEVLVLMILIIGMSGRTGAASAKLGELEECLKSKRQISITDIDVKSGMSAIIRRLRA